MDVSSAFQDALPASYLALVVLVAVGSQWLAWALKIPSILILLVAGFVLGHWWTASEIVGRDVLYAGVSLTVGVILFEGSLSLRWRDVREVRHSVIRLCTLTVLIAWPLITLAALAAGVEPSLAVLLGALLVVTGPTVINPILRQLRPTRRASTMLRWEGIIVDPIGAVLATLVFQGIVADGENRWQAILIALGTTIVLGVGLGLLGGWLVTRLLKRRWVPDFLLGVLVLAVALGAYEASNMLQRESGLVTVTVMGVFLANQQGIRLKPVREFKEHLQVLFVGSLFVLLAGEVTIPELRTVLPVALVFVPLLILVVRPVSIFTSLIGTHSTMRERALLAFMAPRGIVAASVISIFALEMQHHAELATGDQRTRLFELAQMAQDLVPLVFVVVIVTVAVYGLGVGRLAERLGLARTSPQGVLLAGAPLWAVRAGALLRELEIPVKVISSDFRGVRAARHAGLDVVYSHVLSEHAVEEIDLAGLGNFVAVTADDETNSTAVREYGHTFGSNNCYQLRRRDHSTSHRRRASEHLTGRAAFSPALTADQFDARLADGMEVRRTRLSEHFTANDFRETHGEDAVVMFVVHNGRVRVMTPEDNLPGGEAHLIALLPPHVPDVRTPRSPQSPDLDSSDPGSPDLESPVPESPNRD